MNDNPLRAANYADHALQQTVRIVENVRIARDTYRLRFECPEIASRVLPGQFMMMRLDGADDPLLGRALAMYDTADGDDGRPAMVDVVYLVVGKLTGKLAGCETGRRLVVWGPLGNGFSTEPVDHLIMVAGGIGQTPFVALARQMLGGRSYGEAAENGAAEKGSSSERVTLCYGARTADYLACVEDFERVGVEVKISTDDGSRGHHGLVTDLLKQQLDTGSSGVSRRIVCCGPEPMMEAVAKIAQSADVPCQVSLETPMACGIGICFSCVVGVVDESDTGGGKPDESCGWDYKRTCGEGPVFDAAKIRW